MGPQRTRAACDLCYSRKVKCDREEKCKNCRTAQVECRRTRPVRSTRSRQSKISALAKRLEALESSSRAPDSRASSSPTHQAVQEQIQANSHVNGGEPADANSPEKSNNAITSEPTDQCLRANKNILESLDDRAGMDSMRARVLEAALHTIQQISSTGPVFPDIEASTDPTTEQTGLPDSSKPELLYMIAPGDDDRWQDHISKKTLERMVLGLMKREEHEQVLFQYQVCVYSKELFRISRWSTARQNEALNKQLERSQNHYKAAALTALKQVNVMSSPTLTLLQSLLSGAMLMQFLGNMSQSWMLTSFAARTITFLNYHSLNTDPSTEGDIEIHACVFWCHYLDKVLSSLFMKPPSLPKLEINPVLLLHLDSGPSSDVIRFMGYMACLLENALEVQLHLNESSNKEQSAAVLGSLIEETNNLRTRVDNSQLLASNTSKNDKIAAEFCYHTILNNFFQSRFRLLQEDEDQRRCLESARKALSIFVELQSNAVGSNPSQPDASFLTWTILLFPLRPFFSLFCNVVRTSNTQDMQLMQRATLALDPFKTFIPAAKLGRLFETLLDLCRPLFSADMEVSDQSAAVYDASLSLQENIGHLDTNGGFSGPECADPSIDVAEYPGDAEETVPSMPWGEEQMLDLFHSEPCLAWLETVSFSLPQDDLHRLDNDPKTL